MKRPETWKKQKPIQFFEEDFDVILEAKNNFENKIGVSTTNKDFVMKAIRELKENLGI